MQTSKQMVQAACESILAGGGNPADTIRDWACCREAEIDGDGDVWIADPQEGHWLTDDEMGRLADWLRRRVRV